ncbi:MAG: ExbD/TolR family protein [Pseudobdellovibrionaceae bacterium]
MVENSGGDSQEVELNLAPIIDCFTVLITYLLVTASFLTFAAVDVEVSATHPSKQETPPPQNDKPPLTMTLDLDAENQIFLKVSGGDLKKEYEVKLPPKDGKWDEESLEKNLLNITGRWAAIKELSVSAAPTVKYKELVNVINSTQKTLPKVFISGG